MSIKYKEALCQGRQQQRVACAMVVKKSLWHLCLNLKIDKFNIQFFIHWYIHRQPLFFKKNTFL